MAQLLLELFSEEIPAGLQISVKKDLKQIFEERLKKDGIDFKSVTCHSGARRVTVIVEGLPSELKDSVDERRGPRADAPEKAIEGFCKSAGIKKEQLKKKTTPKGDFYFAVIKNEAGNVSDVITDIVQDVICSYTWAKSMKWAENNIRWIRPLHNILCILDGKTLPVKFGHLKANNKSFGHRFMGSGEFEVKNFTDYEKKLRDNFVILDFEERKDMIRKEAELLAKSCGVTIREDEALLNEVAGLVEWPVPLLGRIEEKFMQVPKEVLITAMRSHQKYFSLLNSHGELAPYFITIANIKSSDKGAKIIHGNERVLRARLDDAKFFWDTDRRTSLESRAEGLQKIVFHKKLGTVYDKVERVSELAKLLSVWIPRANLILVERAAKLCKADLNTEMVGEFPELQGLMGSYYALESKEKPEIATAIKEHYSPAGAGDICPTEPVSVAVALADKVDTLTGLFAINEKPTGSKDPYALRRAAIGVIRIILENNLNIPLKLLFDKSISKYPQSIFKLEKKSRKLLPIGGDKKDSVKHKREVLINSLLDFFADRLKALLKEQSVSPDLIHAVFDGGNEDELCRLVARVKALEAFLGTEDGKNLSAAYKRATNIVAAEEKKDKVKYEGEPDKSGLKTDEERELFTMFDELKSDVEKELKEENFENVMKILSKLRKPLDNFFEKVIVNCDDADLRKNRLLLLSQLRSLLDQVANFSKIEG